MRIQKMLAMAPFGPGIWENDAERRVSSESGPPGAWGAQKVRGVVFRGFPLCDHLTYARAPLWALGALIGPTWGPMGPM